MGKKLFSLLLAVVMAFGVIPTAAFASETAPELPKATVSVLDPVTLTAAEHGYMCWPSGDNTIDRPLEIVMNFKANETAEEAGASPFGKFICDFYLTITNLNGDSIIAEGCYLAGNYGAYGWIVIPTNGLEIKEDVSYPIVAAYDAKLTYENICDYVKDFTAAIHIDSDILKANPDMQVKLELRMTNPDVASDVRTVGEPAIYNAKDLGLADEQEASKDFSVVIPEDITVEGGSAEDAAEIVNSIKNNTALKEEGYDPVKGFSDVKTFEVALSYIEMKESVSSKIVYNVEPLDADGNKVSEPDEPITFRLPIPASVEEKYAEVYHEGEYLGIYEIEGEGSGKYVEVTSASFSEFAVVPTDEAPVDDTVYVAVIDRTGAGYASLQAAIEAAKPGDTITLLESIKLAETEPVLLDGAYNTYFKVEGKSVTVNLNGQTISGEYADDKMLVGVFSTDNGGHLTLTGDGFVDVTAGSTVYSLIVNYESDCSVTVEDGSYTLDKAADSLLYSGCSVGANEGITVNGGTFRLGNVNTGTNGKPWIVNCLGSNENHAAVTGGTFNFDVNHQYWTHEVQLPETKAVKANGDGTWTVVDADVYITEYVDGYGHYVGYPTLADAIAAARNGEIVTLLKSITLQKGTDSEQYVGMGGAKKITIDLGGYTLSSVGMRTLIAYTAGTELTVQNGKIASNTSGALTATYNGKLILGKDLEVTSTGNYGVYINRGKLEVPADSSNLTVTGKAKAVGIKAHDDNELIIMAGKYSTIPTGVAEGYGVVKAADGMYEVIAPVQVVDSEGDVTAYATLAAAIANAVDGSTITLNTDFYLYANKENAVTRTVKTDLVDFDGGAYSAFFVIEGKSLTIDLNGHKLQGYAKGAQKLVVGMFVTDNGGHLTLNDSSDGEGLVRIAAQNAKVYSLITNYESGCSITINGGEYTLDKASDSLIYSGASANEGEGDDGIIVNGGTFTLGNVGTGKNGSPWIFNALGANERHIWVTGGTFNADVQHQFWVFEVQMPETVALQNNDGIYTAVPAAAYVTEHEWSSRWYTKNVGYATLGEAFAAAEGPKTKKSGSKEYTVGQEMVVLLANDVKEIVIPADTKGALYLGDCTLTSIVAENAGDIVIGGKVVVENPNGSAITGKVLNITGAENGKLTAIANGDHAYGIGGDQTEKINLKDLYIVTVKGGHVQPLFVSDTKYGKSEPEGGAAIGSGFDGAVINLTNVTIDDARGGSKAAGIGARFHTGVTINIVDCTIKNVEGGNASAGIGGSRVSNGGTESGTTITITGSVITARGGQAGAGIGSGYDTHCQAGQPLCTIYITDSTINAAGGKYAAGIGTGYHNAALAGEIKNSTVTAVSGDKFYKDAYTKAQNIGFGVVDPAREAADNDSCITYNGTEIGIPEV